jgi:hypothetical protein
VPGEYIGVLGVEFQNMLLLRRRPVLAVNDQSLAWCCNNGMAKNVPVRHLVETGIVLPYRSHAFAYSAFHRVRRGLMFHGRQFTFDFGLRKRMVVSRVKQSTRRGLVRKLISFDPIPYT